MPCSSQTGPIFRNTRGISGAACTRKEGRGYRFVCRSELGCPFPFQSVSGDPSQVIPQADLIFVAAPANAHPSILRTVAPYVSRKAALGTLYAQGGRVGGGLAKP